jgi:hypothetical protein
LVGSVVDLVGSVVVGIEIVVQQPTPPQLQQQASTKSHI